MTTMISEVYEAFRAAGVDEAKSVAAAEAIATYDAKFIQLASGLRQLKWMVGVNTTLIVLVLGKLLLT